MNFFFDTPIITEITLELRTSIFDMISAVGGTLGLFTGISVITLVEVAYWIFKLLLMVLEISKSKMCIFGKSLFDHKQNNKTEDVFTFQNNQPTTHL